MNKLRLGMVGSNEESENAAKKLNIAIDIYTTVQETHVSL